LPAICSSLSFGYFGLNSPAAATLIFSGGAPSSIKYLTTFNDLNIESSQFEGYFFANAPLIGLGSACPSTIISLISFQFMLL